MRLFDDFTACVYDTSEGERIARILGPRKAAILRNHGLLTVGESVDEAVWWFITMDRSCQAQLLAEAAGKPIAIDRENALVTRGKWARMARAGSSFSRVAADYSRTARPVRLNQIATSVPGTLSTPGKKSAIWARFFAPPGQWFSSRPSASRLRRSVLSW